MVFIGRAALASVCYAVYTFMNVDGFFGILAGAVMITFIVNGTYFMIYRKNESYCYIVNLLKSLLRRILYGKTV